MSGISYFDIVAVVIVIISAWLAYYRGAVREIMAIVGWIVAGFGSYFAAPVVYPLLGAIPVLSNLVKDSCELGILVAFAVSLAALLLVVSLISYFVSSVAKLPVISSLDRAFGFLFGAARGALVVIIVILAIEAVLPKGPFLEGVTSSTAAQVLENAKESFREQIPSESPRWLTLSYHNLMASCNVIDTSQSG